MERLKEIVKNNKRWIIAAICMVVFLIILEDVLDNEIVNFDKAVYSFVISTKSDIVTSFFKNVTFWGSAVPLISICIVSFIVLKNKKIAALILANLTISAALNLLLKNVIRRDRPIGYRLIEESGFSFPSGHSMASMAFYGLIIYFVIRFVKNRALKIFLSIMLSLLIILIGMSRIYLGVHYPSDVFAGFVFTVAYLIFYITIILKPIVNEKN